VKLNIIISLLLFFLFFLNDGRAAEVQLEEEPYVASTIRFNITSGLTLVNSAPAWGGISAGLSFPIKFPLYVGVETGYFSSIVTINSSSGNTVVTSIPVLLTSKYILNSLSRSFRPYFGFETGLNFVSGVGSYNIAGLRVSGSGQATLFEIALRPGFEFIVDPNVQVTLDAKIGLIGESFLLLPGLGVVISI
jgi:hypothetical protein